MCIRDSIKVVLGRVVRIFLMVIAVIIGLGTVGIDLTILSVFGGALGVGLGFGLQKIASNYVSGFIILLDKSVTVSYTHLGEDRGRPQASRFSFGYRQRTRPQASVRLFHWPVRPAGRGGR